MKSLIVWGMLVVVCGGLFVAEVSAQTRKRPNVLFIAVDDLRPQMGCYGKGMMKTPHLDELASRGVLFERAYCMVPTCGASRASLMTSVRPSPNRFVNHLAWAEKEVPNVVPLNTHFKNSGYTTISLGKVYHHPQDHENGWSEQPWRPGGKDYQDEAGRLEAIALEKQINPNRKEYRGKPYENVDAPDEDYNDYQIASRAIEQLKRFASDDSKPFFLAVGFYKPHLPFVAPKKYWDLYDRSSIQLPENDEPPVNVPEGALHNSGELRMYSSVPTEGPISEKLAITLIHGYYACVSFTDAQIGRLLKSLDENHLRENTIVVLWGDHGWQLGEHGIWIKHTCFETSMHAPLMIAAPIDQLVQPGTRVKGLTEFIDVYPTLCDLASIEKPSHLQGESLVKLMRYPQLPGKGYAVGRYGRGDTVRTEDFRFSEYRNKEGAMTGQMLYDHRVDGGETRNVVGSEMKGVVEALRGELGRVKGRD